MSCVCPACGFSNAPDAVFCANPDCCKALGEFPFVLEEMRAAGRERWHETLAERVAGFIGRPHFFAVHLVWFTVWVTLNTGLVAVVRRFDDYPFGLLGILLSAEAIFITGFLLLNMPRRLRRGNRLSGSPEGCPLAKGGVHAPPAGSACVAVKLRSNGVASRR